MERPLTVLSAGTSAAAPCLSEYRAHGASLSSSWKRPGVLEPLKRRRHATECRSLTDTYVSSARGHTGISERATPFGRGHYSVIPFLTVRRLDYSGTRGHYMVGVSKAEDFSANVLREDPVGARIRWGNMRDPVD